MEDRIKHLRKFVGAVVILPQMNKVARVIDVQGQEPSSVLDIMAILSFEDGSTCSVHAHTIIATLDEAEEKFYGLMLLLRREWLSGGIKLARAQQLSEQMATEILRAVLNQRW